MKLKITSTLKNLTTHLNDLQENVPLRGAEWAEQSANIMATLYKAHLANQGRKGGRLPMLSPATLHIYEMDGPPDGSGVSDHVEQGLLQNYRQVIGYVGIPLGKPTLIANVQNHGAMIPVTEDMRGFLAAEYGIFLRAETKQIYIPPRYSWDDSIRQARTISKKLSERIIRPQ